MNTSPTVFADLDPADRAFAAAAQRALRSGESLDYVESARLSAARRQAVDALSQRAPRRGWLLAPMGAALAAALLVTVLPARLGTPAIPAPAVNETNVAALEWAADEAGPDFYRDLEFYQWLSQQQELERLPEPNA